MRILTKRVSSRNSSGNSYRFRPHTRPARAETTYIPAKVSGDFAPLPAVEQRAMVAGELRLLARQVEMELPVDIRSVRLAFRRLSELAA